MSTIPQRGQIIFEWLDKRRNQRFKLAAVLAGTDLDNSAKTRAAIRYARTLAEDRGLCLPYADAANKYTYTITDKAAEVVDAGLIVSRQAQGMKKFQYYHDDFMEKQRLRGLTATEQKFVSARIKKEKARRLEEEADNEQAAALIEMRAQLRKLMAAPKGEPA